MAPLVSQNSVLWYFWRGAGCMDLYISLGQLELQEPCLIGFGLWALTFLVLVRWTGTPSACSPVCRWTAAIRLQLPGAGDRRDMEANCDSCQWAQVSAPRWSVAADKPGCQEQWMLAPLILTGTFQRQGGRAGGFTFGRFCSPTLSDPSPWCRARSRGHLSLLPFMLLVGYPDLEFVTYLQSLGCLCIFP